MPVPLLCPYCEFDFRAEDSSAGKTARCPECNTSVRVPERDEIPVLRPLDEPPFGAPRRPRPRVEEDGTPSKAAYWILGAGFGGLILVLGVVALIASRDSGASSSAASVLKPKEVIRFEEKDWNDRPKVREPLAKGMVDPNLAPPPLPPGAIAQRLLPPEAGTVMAMRWDREGKNLHVATFAQQNWVLRESTSQFECLLAPPPVGFDRGDWSSTTFSPNGDRVAVTRHGGHLTLIDLPTRQTRLLSDRGPSGYAQWQAAFSPDGTKLVTSHGDQRVKFWNLNTGQLEKELTGFKGQVTSVAFNSAGTVIATASEKEVLFFDAASHAPRGTIPVDGEFTFSRMEFIDSDRTLVGLEGKRICLLGLKLDGTTYREADRASLDFSEIAIQFRLSPDLKYLLVGTLSKVELWDRARREKVHTFEQLQQSQGLAFHPTDGRIAIAQGNRLLFYDLRQIARAK